MVLIALINSTYYQAEIKIDISINERKLNVEETGVHNSFTKAKKIINSSCIKYITETSHIVF
jgi:hypothetical protein